MTAPQQHSTTAYQRTDCVFCGKDVAVEPGTGKYSQHGARRKPCPASRLTRELAGDWYAITHFLRESWRVGDALRVSSPNMPYPTAQIPEGLDLEGELEYLIQHARDWIDTVYWKLYAEHRV